jgi:hypothetical protein
LVLLVILVGATSLNAARTVTVPRGGMKKTPAQKVKPAKYDVAEKDVEDIIDDAVKKLSTKVGGLETSGLPISTEDHNRLIMAIKELRQPGHQPKPILQSQNAKDIFKLVSDTFYKINSHPDLMPGQGFGMAVSFANEAMGIVAGYYVSTVHGTSSIGANGPKAAAKAEKRTYK